jgi:hypothetical protein
MSGMRTVVVDKIASVTQACGLSHEIRIAADIPCEEGLVVVVEILNNKSTYNTLELTSGRMAKVARGDVVVGALGHRKALFGYSGHIPATLKPGDVIQMLNIGGVMGICDSATQDKGNHSTARCWEPYSPFRISASASACRPERVTRPWTTMPRWMCAACR